MKQKIQEIFAASIAAQQQFLEENIDTLVAVVDLLARTFTSGRKLLLFGNGGSAADAQHIAAEFVNRYLVERPPLPALALTTDTSVLTSVSNDYSFAEVFARQVRALGQTGDVALAISTSGSSANVLKALEVCREMGIHTVGLTGGSGGALASRVDYLLRVPVRGPATTTPRIQETHILIGHVLCELVDELLFRQG
jgi:D-sedoheptulose 7-phosphate isomerase